MSVRLVAVVVLALSASVPAGAASQPGWEQRRGQAALELVRYPWPELGYQIVFLPARRGYRAMTFPDRRRIEVYVRRSDSLTRTAFDLAHELGHAVDVSYLSDEERARWRALRGIEPRRRWYGCSRCDDLSTPAGDFAEVFAYWRVRRADYFAGRLGPLPSAVELRQLDAFMQPSPLPADRGWSLWRWAVVVLLQLPEG